MGLGQTATLPIPSQRARSQQSFLPVLQEMPPSPSPTSAVGENRLAGYEIVNRIASGGMGTVYLARHLGTQRSVALKLLSPHIAHDTEFIARFKREAHIVAALDHPHIVQVFDAGYADGYYYLAMEYLPYGSLKGELKRYSKSGEGIPVDRVQEMVRQMASALDHAHRRGLVHRDVKPSNILRAAGDRYVLTDFGVALDTEATRLTRNPDSIGTPEYMSPEQIEQKRVDARSDLYSLGVVMYELLTGVPPFDAEQPMVILMKHVHEAPPPLAGYRSDVPKSVLCLVERLLLKDPDKRFQTASELIRAIEAIQGVPGATQMPPRRLRWPRPSLNNVLAFGRIGKPTSRQAQRMTFLRPILMGVFSAVGVISIVLVSFLIISPATVGHALARLGMINEAPVAISQSRSVAFRSPAEVYLNHDGDAPIPIRLGPDDAYAAIAAEETQVTPPSSRLQVIGRGRDAQWLQVQVPGQPPRVGWVRASDGTLEGKISSVPISPAPPVSAARPYTATFNIQPMNTVKGSRLNKPITLTWNVQGVVAVELRMSGLVMLGFDCPVGDVTRVLPQLPMDQRMSLAIPSGQRSFVFAKPGYYLLAFTMEKADGSVVREMRYLNVACARQTS